MLTTRELNRALLARQLLLRRASLPIPAAIERLGALQAQWPPSPYLALWTRLRGFRREQLVRAISARRVVKATLMRVTLHHVSASDYLSYAGLVRGARVAALRRRVERERIADELPQLAAAARALTADAPRSRPELLELLGLGKLPAYDPHPWLVWHLVVAEAELVHTPEGSVWRSNTAGSRFVPAPVWLGAPSSDGAAAAEQLVRRYLAAFGPATRADIAQWTGLPVAALEPGLQRLRLRHFRDERGRELLDLPRAPLPPADTPAPVRFLPVWDSVLLAHDDRSRILPEEHRATVIRRNGDVQATFLVDGLVAGTWSVEDGRVELEPFALAPTADASRAEGRGRGARRVPRMTRILSERELNRALLARQLLLTRPRLPLPRALERLGGIQNQYAPNGYIRLWSCVDGFRRQGLDRALSRRVVVQGTLMRSTIHLVSARDYWPFALGIRQARREWWLRLQKGAVSERVLRRRAAAARRAFAGGALEDRELKRLGHGDVGLWLDLLRAPPSGTWERRRASLYAVAEDWLGPSAVSADEGLAHLVRSYLGAFGPASRHDVSAFTGVPAAQLLPVLERLRLRRFLDGEGRELLDAPRAPLPAGDTPAPVRFLPTWDAALLVHARRTGILPERYRPVVFSIKVPPSMPTFLVDGAVAGRWQVERSGDRARLTITPFEPLPRGSRRELEEEGAGLLRFHEPDAARLTVAVARPA